MAEERSVEPREVRDWRGRSYRIGETPQDLMGWPRWSMLALAWLAMATVGVLQYGYGAAVPALTMRNGWSPVEVFWPLAAWVVFQAGVGMPAAYLLERGRVGSRVLTLIGAVCCEVGVFVLAHSTSLAVVLVGYSVVGGAGAGLVYAACTSVVTRWYPERRGMRVGQVTGAFAYGSVPVVVAMVLGLRADVLGPALLTASVVIFMLVAAAGLLMVDPPARWWPAETDPRAWALGRQNPSAAREFSAIQALRTRVLPLMVLILMGAGAISLFDAAFLIVIVGGLGVGVSVTAVAAGLVLACNGATRAAAISVSDRLGRRRTLGAVLAIQAVAQVLLAVAVTTAVPALLIVAAALAGLGGGAFYPLFASLAREYFGEERAFEVHGIVYCAKAGSGILGIGLAASAVAAWGPVAALLLAAAVGAVCTVAATALRRPGLPSTLPTAAAITVTG
ncbi:MFS transporter [Pseudonocardia sp. CA-107938]|uniref:MFS transporter n=1 Tax=Pseudonocardia sp. CA-107938 TaxID=3240021 RepID=UPI003D8F6704